MGPAAGRDAGLRAAARASARRERLRRRGSCAAVSGATTWPATARSTSSTSRCCGPPTRSTRCPTGPARHRGRSTTSTRASRTTATGTGCSAASTSSTCGWPRSAHLIAAEDLADAAVGRPAAGRRRPYGARLTDTDLDAIDEVLVTSPGQTVVVDLAEGAGDLVVGSAGQPRGPGLGAAAPARGIPRSGSSPTSGRRTAATADEAPAGEPPAGEPAARPSRGRRPGRSTTSSRPRSRAWPRSSTTTATSVGAASSTCCPPAGRRPRRHSAAPRTWSSATSSEGAYEPVAVETDRIVVAAARLGRRSTARSAAVASRRRTASAAGALDPALSLETAVENPGDVAARVRAGGRVERQPARRRPQPGGLLRDRVAASGRRTTPPGEMPAAAAIAFGNDYEGVRIEARPSRPRASRGTRSRPSRTPRAASSASTRAARCSSAGRSRWRRASTPR